MPTILGPTNPVPGQEPQPLRITTPQPGDTSIQNIVNPQQVTRPDNRTQRQDTGDAAQQFIARYDSNFMTFVQRLRSSPDLAATFFQLIQGGGLQVTSGIQAGFAEEIAQFLEFLQMDEGQMVNFLQNQAQSGTRFTGPLFQMLRDAYAGTSSEVARNDILQTLHRFSDWSSTPHLERKILNTLDEMGKSLPSRWANQLNDLTQRLERGMAAGAQPGLEGGRAQSPFQARGQGQAVPGQDPRAASAWDQQGAARTGSGRGAPWTPQNFSQPAASAAPAVSDRQGNLKLLREQVFPLISQYVTLTHNHGRARGLLSMLALDVARYENGSEKPLLQAVRHLSLNGALPRELERLPDSELLRLLRTTDYAKASQSNSFADRLSELTDRALQGEGGTKTQEAFRDILSSLLINESVYMPLLHLMIPVQWENRLMFSELWVDPDADGDRQNPSPKGDGTLRILLKMDIQDVGAFDLLINARGEDASLQVACPPEVAAFSEQITGSLGKIMERNGYHAEVTVGEMQRPVTISEVFPRIFEKASGVNVTV